MSHITTPVIDASIPMTNDFVSIGCLNSNFISYYVKSDLGLDLDEKYLFHTKYPTIDIIPPIIISFSNLPLLLTTDIFKWFMRLLYF